MLKVHNPTISYTSVSVNLLQKVNAPSGQAGAGGAKNLFAPGLQSGPSAAVSAIMRIIVESEGLKASLHSTGNALRMEVERYEGSAKDGIANITQVRASGSGNMALSVISSNDDDISVGTGDGNDSILVAGKTVFGVHGGKGNDQISILGHKTGSQYGFDSTVDLVDGGDGNDAIAIVSRGNVDRVEGGDGNDAIAISAKGSVERLDGGDGNDAIAISTEGSVDRIYGGDGNDAIAISAKGSVSRFDSGDGNDAIAIASDDSVRLIDAGDGNDTISVTARWSAGASGGDGNDVMRLSGGSAWASGGDGNDVIQLSGKTVVASGGTGNDRITLDSTSGKAATLYFAEGDGNDTVETNAPLQINRISEDGTARLDPAKAKLAHNDDGTVTVSFEGSGDTMTVKFTGAMAGREIVATVKDGRLWVGPKS